ncbi:MAG: protein-L-isoaspartate(D-aspartate) O-methyltransferase [Thermoanaerobaculales bacterium]|nr:protein-L-isoaspartate(D-aspartate) O-methyltransferase [Thermoanaerobaculales bacterium]
MTAADGYDYRRVQMVEALERLGITDLRVLEAMRRVPRDLFVPEAYRQVAYSEDVSINIGEGQTISQPRVVASMTQAARIGADDKVLEIGTGSGYQAAVLAQLARFVFSVERIPSLARTAKATLDHLGIENVTVKVMDGTLGWRAFAPFDAILVTAAAPEVPQPLVEQLAEGGRLVVPVGARDTQVIRVVERRGARTVVSELQGACFVPLIGRHGWAGEGR